MIREQYVDHQDDDAIDHEQMSEFETSLSEVREVGERVLEILKKLLLNADKDLYPARLTKSELESICGLDYPLNRGEVSAVLDQLELNILPNLFNGLNSNVLQSISSPLPVLAFIDCITSFINLQPHGQLAVHMEETVIKWMGKWIGFSDDANGLMVQGGAQANLYALAVARIAVVGKDVRNEGITGGPKLIAYISEEGHLSLKKSTELLGMGAASLISVETDDLNRIKPETLEEKIKSDLAAGYLPYCIIGTIGTPKTGAIDDITALRKIADRYNLWLHIDGAYGGLAAIAPEKSELKEMIPLSDSICINLHKWLNIPYESSCLLLKEKEQLLDTFSGAPDYLGTLGEDEQAVFNSRFEFSQINRSLKVWVAFQYYGVSWFEKLISSHLTSIQGFAENVRNNTEMELALQPDLTITCFRYVPGDLDNPVEHRFYLNNLNRAIEITIKQKEGILVGSTMLQNQLFIRICVMSHRFKTSTLSRLLARVQEHGKALDQKMRKKN